ncbi:MAG TPA: hypothetical protein VFQ77_15585 [Pseudonocardiaceae bacterium]|jgi:uncharacterized protein YjbJ (UPF0337 family)|nr:hypothetical protein [Pseudonocardiaceae bacterium]
MLSNRLQARIEHATGRAKQWAGQATRNRSRKRAGSFQTGLAYARIKLMDGARRLTKAVRRRRIQR